MPSVWVLAFMYFLLNSINVVRLNRTINWLAGVEETFHQRIANLEQTNNLLGGIIKNTNEIENSELKTRLTKLFIQYAPKESSIIVDADGLLGINYFQYQNSSLI